MLGLRRDNSYIFKPMVVPFVIDVVDLCLSAGRQRSIQAPRMLAGVLLKDTEASRFHHGGSYPGVTNISGEYASSG